MRRASFMLALAGALALALGGIAGASEGGQQCSTLGLTQTYHGWGPAVTYGKTVTVQYHAPGCSDTQGATLELLREGTATVYAGTGTGGAVIDQRPFLVRGVWEDPHNPAGWPLAWWNCDVAVADYQWEIPGVYRFSVTARAGQWTLTVSTQGGPDVHWQHDGCA